MASKASVTDATQEAGQQSALRTFPSLKTAFLRNGYTHTCVEQYAPCVCVAL